MILRLPGISLDIDRPDDLLTFLTHYTETRTHRALAGSGVIAWLRTQRRT
jgi:2-phospho-L-lactate guanylyltransferase (CobY/MobA/RfbA family)